MTEVRLPIACTLAPAEMPQRGDEIRALGRDGLEAVERIVAAESRCCAFLDFTVTEAEDATVLTIAAPEGAQPALHDLADLFSDRRY